ncbi:MAG TPA: integron cassette protein [Deltaproteobacteria bacterium]|nr:MAG: integron cassette protein [Deltaproteobacteria bacterium GWD2_42_10]OGQ72706.1 MAG: integron cassette protein [Deltaproteobacteria bacterium RIFOXYA2_FULL_42_10]HAG51217.1 integron cassette protein [Deltaproteobacteria bacterium]HCY19857.1 integron cassette protein [Deltaproteobacteria bacterium]
MKLSRHGKGTLSASVENITPFGIWILIGNEEYFLSYKDFPMFLNKPIKNILNVKQLNYNHLYWPDMDVDLELDSIKNPQKYPLIAV